MHSFLIIGSNEKNLEDEIGRIITDSKLKRIDFELQKIGHVRELISFTKLALSKPTAIVIKNIDSATTEGLNAFLKNLEEPQENLKYILTASSEYKVLSTILSRCQIIKTENRKQKTENRKAIRNFINSSVGKKLAIVNKIRKREEAIDFVYNLTITYHNLLHTKTPDYQMLAQNLKASQKTHLALNQNGNVTLQLANFVINL